MAIGATIYVIEDDKSFDDNIDAFAKVIEASDPVLANALKLHLKDIAAGSVSYANVWDALLDAAAASPIGSSSGSAGTSLGAAE